MPKSSHVSHSLALNFNLLDYLLTWRGGQGKGKGGGWRERYLPLVFGCIEGIGLEGKYCHNTSIIKHWNWLFYFSLSSTSSQFGRKKTDGPVAERNPFISFSFPLPPNQAKEIYYSSFYILLYFFLLWFSLMLNIMKEKKYGLCVANEWYLEFGLIRVK